MRKKRSPHQVNPITNTSSNQKVKPCTGDGGTAYWDKSRGEYCHSLAWAGTYDRFGVSNL